MPDLRLAPPFRKLPGFCLRFQDSRANGPARCLAGTCDHLSLKVPAPCQVFAAGGRGGWLFSSISMLADVLDRLGRNVEAEDYRRCQRRSNFGPLRAPGDGSYEPYPPLERISCPGLRGAADP